MERTRPWAILAATLSAGAIGYFTLRPSLEYAAEIPATCLLCGERGGADLVLNVLLFLPLGVALGWLRIRAVRAAGIGLVLAALIEFAQTVIPGRAPTWRDIAMNAIGAGVGAAITWNALALLRSAFARRLAWASGGIAVLTVFATGWLLQPQSKATQWFGLLAPRLRSFEPWSGRLDSVRVADHRITHGDIREVDAVRRAVQAHSAIRVFGSAATPPGLLAPIFLITDVDEEEMLLIGQEGTDLVLRERRRAAKLRLQQPQFRLKGLFAGHAPGEPFLLEVRFAPTSACATLDGVDRCASPLAASSAWTLLLWRAWIGQGTQRALGALTLFGLLLPAGFFGAALRLGAVAALAAAIAIGIQVATSITGLAAADVLEWTAIGSGLGIGALAGRMALRAASAVDRASAPT